VDKPLLKQKEEHFLPFKAVYALDGDSRELSVLVRRQRKAQELRKHEGKAGLTQDCIYRLDFANWEWDKIVRGVQPKNRDSYGIGVFKNFFILFGGSDHETIFNDMWSFNFETELWEEIEQANKIPGRDICQLLTLNDNTMLLFGGLNTNLIQAYADMYLYNLTTALWT
jgi:hypothetical protein